MKPGIIIQGPLISFGQGPNNSKDGFVALKTILDNIERIKERGYCYIVSLWSPSTEQERNIIEELARNNVSLTHVSSPRVFDPDHRYKQHYGVLNGAEELLGKCRDITHLVKIRTDMLMPDAFWDWVQTACSGDEGRLFVSELMNRPYYQGDFIYLANRERLLSFLATVVNYASRIIHPSIAFDMGIKNCEAQNFGVFYGRGLRGRIRFWADFFFRTGATRKYWNQFISKHVGVMPKAIWQDIIWRDRRIGSFLNAASFKFDCAPINEKITLRRNLRNLLREYKVYRTKCRKCPAK